MDNDHSIILFDGVCNFCNGSVNFVMDRDKKGRFKFGALQSDQGKALLKAHYISPAPGYDSIILIKQDKVYQKSSAALEIAKGLGGLWPLLAVFKVIPPFLRNWVYDVIAKNRYRWFGQSEACRIPDPDLKDRFL